MNCDITTIIVCVEYHDFLSVTLPHNLPLLGRVLVVTDPEDEESISVAERNGVDILTTKVFFERDALFNKWAAVNQGFSYLSVSGWCLVLDADLLLPRASFPWKINSGKLYKARRTQVADWKKKIEPEENWKRNKKIREFPAGHFHLFHSADSAVRKMPYLNCWRWCGTGDHEFESHWPESQKVLMPFDVVHLGTPEVNWCGRSEVFRDGSSPGGATERLSAMQGLRRQTRINAGLDDKYQGDRIL